MIATGQKSKPCYSILDTGEGQTPEKMPETLLSLGKSNKLRIPFVQGKFNMGGTGVLQFCGEKNIQLIEDGGWHFNYLEEPEKISKKLKAFAHTVYNNDEFTNIYKIKKNIYEMRDLFNRGHQYYKVQLDNTYPDYILNNQNKFYKWIKQ